MDYACVEGFCPSFVSIEGVQVRRSSGSGIDIEALAAKLPTPSGATLETTHNILFTGVGGQGVSTSSAVLAMAGHMDGLQAATLDMTGLAQKGGPVTSHIRIARREPNSDRPIYGSRVPVGGLDVMLGGDIIVAAGREALEYCDPKATVAILNGKIAPTAEFVLNQRLSAEPDTLQDIIKSASKQTFTVDFSAFALRLLGDAIFANMMLIGFAWQHGLVPISNRAIEDAILLNGVAAKSNRMAFLAGRVAAHDISLLEVKIDAAPKTADIPFEERISFLSGELVAYQNQKYADAFETFVADAKKAEAGLKKSKEFTRAIAENLYKLMAYKDEYEVARLYSSPEFAARVASQFEGNGKMSIYLAPPLLARKDPETGGINKMKFGPWILNIFKVMAAFKGLRGGLFDPFGYLAERKTERLLIPRISIAYRDAYERPREGQLCAGRRDRQLA